MTGEHTGGSNLNVPPQNDDSNVTIVDVIGNKRDNHRGDSIYARLDELYDAFQRERFVYPSLAAGAAVISPAAVWTYGNYATIMPANTFTRDFHILVVSIESCTVAAGVFQLELYKGATDSIITAIRFAMAGGFWGNMVYAIGSGEVVANSRVRARLASSVGAATITISFDYFLHL